MILKPNLSPLEMKLILCCLLCCFLTSVYSQGVITITTGCNNPSSSDGYWTPGELVTLSCLANNTVLPITIPYNNILRWTTPRKVTLIVTGQAEHSIARDTSSSGVVYTAIRTSPPGIDVIVNSTLSFTATQMEDGVVIRCDNAQKLTTPDTCVLLVYSK
jgi:hypothetical protein